FTIRDPKAPGSKRQQTWHYPSRNECISCHNMAAKYVLGTQTFQINRDHDYGGVVANQLSTYEHIGLFTKPLPSPPEDMPRLVDYRDASKDINLRARSYLHANCSYCHRKWGGGNAEFQFLATLDLSDTGTLGVRPGQGTFNIPNAKILAAHDPYRSAMFYRMSTLGPGRMPRIGSNVIDEQGVKLIHDWIAQLPGAGLVADERTRALSAITATLKQLRSPDDASPDKFQKQLEPLLASTSAALQFAQSFDGLPEKVRNAAVARAAK